MIFIDTFDLESIMISKKNIFLLLILLIVLTVAGVFSFHYFKFSPQNQSLEYQIDDGQYYFLKSPELSYPSGSSSDKKVAIKQFVDNEFKNLRNFAYLSVKNQKIFINDTNGKYEAAIKDNSWIRFHGEWFRLSNTFSGSPILISEDRIVTLPLSQGQENLSYLQDIRKNIEDRQTYFAKHIQEFKDKIKKWDLISVQSGIPVALTDTDLYRYSLSR